MGAVLEDDEVLLTASYRANQGWEHFCSPVFTHERADLFPPRSGESLAGPLWLDREGNSTPDLGLALSISSGGRVVLAWAGPTYGPILAAGAGSLENLELSAASALTVRAGNARVLFDEQSGALAGAGGIPQEATTEAQSLFVHGEDSSLYWRNYRAETRQSEPPVPYESPYRIFLPPQIGWPTRTRREIASEFRERCVKGGDRVRNFEPHTGLDLEAKSTAPLFAPEPGRVFRIASSHSGGNQFGLRHDSSGTASNYTHAAINVAVESCLQIPVFSDACPVLRGEEIGISDASGTTESNAHLHYSFALSGQMRPMRPKEDPWEFQLKYALGFYRDGNAVSRELLGIRPRLRWGPEPLLVNENASGRVPDYDLVNTSRCQGGP